VSTALYASDNAFGNYKSGVFDQCTSTKCNHAVTVVGWGNENGKDFWLIKNSWGSNWGANGFMKVKKMPYYNAIMLRRATSKSNLF
jgi:C1A family cysteine protease